MILSDYLFSRGILVVLPVTFVKRWPSCAGSLQAAGADHLMLYLATIAAPEQIEFSYACSPCSLVVVTPSADTPGSHRLHCLFCAAHVPLQ